MPEDILQFFQCDHLPQNLQVIANPFKAMAQMLVVCVPRNPERTVALRKLLESKDCAVRAVLFKKEET